MAAGPSAPLQPCPDGSSRIRARGAGLADEDGCAVPVSIARTGGWLLLEDFVLQFGIAARTWITAIVTLLIEDDQASTHDLETIQGSTTNSNTIMGTADECRIVSLCQKGQATIPRDSGEARHRTGEQGPHQRERAGRGRRRTTPQSPGLPRSHNLVRRRDGHPMRKLSNRRGAEGDSANLWGRCSGE